MLRTPPLIEDAIPSLDLSAYLAGGRAAHVVWHGLYQVVTGGSPGFADWDRERGHASSPPNSASRPKVI